MPQVVLWRKKPAPGTRADDLHIPDPGLYEVDLAVPDWMAWGDFALENQFDFDVPGYVVHHFFTRHDEQRSLLTIRFRVDENPATRDDRAIAETEFIQALTIGVVLRGVAVVVGSWLAVKLLQVVVEFVREIRKLVEVSTPAVAVGLGILAISLWGDGS